MPPFQTERPALAPCPDDVVDLVLLSTIPVVPVTPSPTPSSHSKKKDEATNQQDTTVTSYPDPKTHTHEGSNPLPNLLKSCSQKKVTWTENVIVHTYLGENINKYQGQMKSVKRCGSKIIAYTPRQNPTDYSPQNSHGSVAVTSKHKQKKIVKVKLRSRKIK